jgi:CBS domain-containing protein
MKARDVMVRNPITVGPDDSVGKAINLLAEHDISALPVVDGAGEVVGILSEADLVRREELATDRRRPWWLEALTPATTLAEEFAKAHGRKVHEVMSDRVVSASEDTPLAEIASLLERNRIKRVPVLRGGKLVGIVSRANLIQALATQRVAQEEEDGSVLSDRDIRDKIQDALATQKWTDFGSRNITVQDGVVHVWGLVGSPEEHKALLALIEGVGGVLGISDETIPAY